MTTNNMMLTSSPFWTCDNHGDSVGPSEYSPSHRPRDQFMTKWQPPVMREKFEFPNQWEVVAGGWCSHCENDC